MVSTLIGKLRVIAFLEGVSFLVLLGIAMPLKYMAGKPEAVKIIGMAHGVLFILYVLLVLICMSFYKWSMKKVLLALVASVLPFGPFIADRKLFRDEQVDSTSKV